MRAHPRVGGENEWDGISRVETYGSSPRGRGKPGGVVGQRDELRLIPAWAGKTSSRSIGTAQPWAHPRVGGENWKSFC